MVFKPKMGQNKKLSILTHELKYQSWSPMQRVSVMLTKGLLSVSSRVKGILELKKLSRKLSPQSNYTFNILTVVRGILVRT